MASHRRILDDHKSVYLCSTCNVTAPTPPSLPPPPPPSPVDDSSNHRLRLLFVAVAVFSAFLLLSLTYFAVLRRRRRYGGAFLSARASSGGSPPSDAGEVAGSAFDEAEEPLHPIWFIRTVGLDEATIDKIDVAEYKAGDGLLAGATGDCSVCLGEFSDGELIRLLPKCGHAFHLPCIDTWLRAHVNCPLCRANIVDSTGVAPHPTGTSAVGSPADVDMPSSVPVDSPPIGIQASDQEQNRTADSDTVVDIVAPANPIELPDSAAESSVTRSQNEQEEGLLLPVRRSASMDSPFLEAVVVRLEPQGSFDSVATEEGKPGDIAEQSIRRSRRKQGNNSKGSLDRNAQLEIERSLSSSARGFFCRHSRMSRDSSLPL